MPQIGEIMKVTYIYHSCFTVEEQDVVLIFDYFKGDLPQFDNEKKIYVFSSHKHADHFNRMIFELAKDYKNISFLLSNDIKMNEKYMERIQIPQEARDKIQYMHKNETHQISKDLKVETLTSTDEGVAFVVTLFDKIIYFAGDLNWWTWKGETEEEYQDMTNRFLTEIKKLKGRHLDLAFLPLDGRQEERFYLGFDHVMREAKVCNAFPMHYWEKPEAIKKLKEMDVSKDYRDRILDVVEPGQVFEC